METVAARAEAGRHEPRVLTTTYLSAKQIAVILGVTPKTVYTWAQIGLIPHVRIGRKVRFALEEVIARGQANARKSTEVMN